MTDMIPVVRTRGGVIVDIVRYSGTNALVKPRTGNGMRRHGWWAPLEWLDISEAPRPSVRKTARAKSAAR